MTVYKTGITALSFTQQLLITDPTKFVVGGKLYMYEAATTTPVQPYADANAQFLMSNPYTLGADGRIPLFYFIIADDLDVPGTLVTRRSSVRMRLLDKNGLQQFDYEVIPLMTSDPGSSTGPAPTPIDPLGAMKTGMMISRYGVGKIPGFVRANGLTIGSTGSPASELNDDLLAQALYLYLYGADPSLVVVGGRTGNAAADFAASKPLTLPDWSGSVMGFLDNMSDNPRGILTSATFPSPLPTVLGAFSGLEQKAIPKEQLPVLTLTVTIPSLISGVPQWTHTHGPGSSAGGADTAFVGVRAPGNAALAAGAGGVEGSMSTTGPATMPTLAGTAPLGGSGQSTSFIQPTKLCTLYLRL